MTPLSDYKGMNAGKGRAFGIAGPPPDFKRYLQDLSW